MKVNKKMADALSYLSGNKVEAGELPKDFIFDHDFAKKIFGEKNTSGYHGGQPDWKGRLQSLVMYTDDELSDFFINLHNWYKTVDSFKELNIIFVNDDDKPSPSSNGEIYIFRDHYQYFKPLYDYLISIGFKLDRVYRSGTFNEDHSIYISNDNFDISFKIKNNSFHDSWWYFDLSGNNIPKELKSLSRGFKNPGELLIYIKSVITECIKAKFIAGGKQDIREMKSYMLINDVDEFDAEEYLKYLENE